MLLVLQFEAQGVLAGHARREASQTVELWVPRHHHRARAGRHQPDAGRGCADATSLILVAVPYSVAVIVPLQDHKVQDGTERMNRWFVTDVTAFPVPIEP